MPATPQLATAGMPAEVAGKLEIPSLVARSRAERYIAFAPQEVVEAHERRAALQTSIPSATDYSFRKGDKGTVVWALQKGLDAYGENLVADGDFGDKTKAAVQAMQSAEGIAADGIFGPTSSSRLARALQGHVPTSVPPGSLRGLVEGESGELLGAVSWLTPGGVDCGYCQRRVYESDYGNLTVERRAFDPLYQLNLLGKNLRSKHNGWYGQPGARTHEQAWRCAIQSHNYPSGAEKVALNGPTNLTPYYYAQQSWVTNIGARFDDGYSVKTPWQWMQFYAFGSSGHNHEGVMARKVTAWIT